MPAAAEVGVSVGLFKSAAAARHAEAQHRVMARTDASGRATLRWPSGRFGYARLWAACDRGFAIKNLHDLQGAMFETLTLASASMVGQGDWFNCVVRTDTGREPLADVTVRLQTTLANGTRRGYRATTDASGRARWPSATLARAQAATLLATLPGYEDGEMHLAQGTVGPVALRMKKKPIEPFVVFVTLQDAQSGRSLYGAEKAVVRYGQDGVRTDAPVDRKGNAKLTLYPDPARGPVTIAVHADGYVVTERRLAFDTRESLEAQLETGRSLSFALQPSGRGILLLLERSRDWRRYGEAKTQALGLIHTFVTGE